MVPDFRVYQVQRNTQKMCKIVEKKKGRFVHQLHEYKRG